MEQQVQHGFQSAAHPLYSLAAKQLQTYRTVSMPVRPGKRGRPKKSERDAWLLQNRLAATSTADHNGDDVQVFDPSGLGSPRATTNATGGGGGTSAGTAPTMSSTTTASLKPPPRAAGVTAGRASAAGGNAVLTPAVLQQWTTSFARLETLLARNQPPVLPSPLHELHEIKVRTTDSSEMELIRPYYDDALGKFLTQASTQATNSAHPQMLPNLLQGLDTLRAGVLREERPQVSTLASINFTYKTVLAKYLELTNPTVASSNARKRKSTSGEAASSSKRSHVRDQDDNDAGAASV